MFLEMLQWLEMSALALALNESAYLYAMVEGTHVLSLALSVGMILWFDLRLLGIILRGESLKAMYASIRPWLFTGFFLMIATGLLLFTMRPLQILGNTLFQIKMSLLVLCLLNILVYHFVIEKSLAGWDGAVTTPITARLAGGLSLLLWFSVIAVGRFMAYSL